MFSDSFPEIKFPGEMVMEDKDYVEPKKTGNKDTDNEKDIYEIVDDLGFLGNVEQEKTKINISKKKK